MEQIVEAMRYVGLDYTVTSEDGKRVSATATRDASEGVTCCACPGEGFIAYRFRLGESTPGCWAWTPELAIGQALTGRAKWCRD